MRDPRQLKQTGNTANRCARLRGALGVALLLPGLLGAAPAIQITSPADGASLTWMPIDVALDFDEAADDPTLQVLLNGNDVTGLLVVDPASGGRVATHGDDVWSGFVLPGANTLTATVDLGGAPQNASVSFDAVGDPYADAVVQYTQGPEGGFNAGQLPGIVLGAPAGSGMFLGSLDTVSLGKGGSIEVEFTDNVVVDGPGDDFAVFENAFLEIGAGSITQPPFAEPGRVGVSQDGVVWSWFDCTLTEAAGPYWPGCAGVYPVLSNGTAGSPHASVPTTVPIEALVGVSVHAFPLPAGAGGDRFDLADVGLPWIRFVRVEAAPFDPPVFGGGNSAFDFDAVAAIHSSPTVPLPAAGVVGHFVLAALLIVGAVHGLGGVGRRS